MSKWYEEIVLMEQDWLHDDSKKVRDALTDLIAEIGENLVIRRFSRFAIGESSEQEQAAE